MTSQKKLAHQDLNLEYQYQKLKCCQLHHGPMKVVIRGRLSERIVPACTRRRQVDAKKGCRDESAKGRFQCDR